MPRGPHPSCSHTGRTYREVIVADLDDYAIEAFVQAESGRDLTIQAGTPESVAKCGVISTTTPAREPILRKDWIAPGTHINAIGADTAGKQELETALITDATVVIDEWEQCAHSGEINVPVSTNSFTKADVSATLGEVVAGQSRNDRRTKTTVSDLTGLAIQDIAVAEQVYEAAIEQDDGDVIDIIGA